MNFVFVFSFFLCSSQFCRVRVVWRETGQGTAGEDPKMMRDRSASLLGKGWGNWVVQPSPVALVLGGKLQTLHCANNTRMLFQSRFASRSHLKGLIQPCKAKGAWMKISIVRTLCISWEFVPGIHAPFPKCGNSGADGSRLMIRFPLDLWAAPYFLWVETTSVLCVANISVFGVFVQLLSLGLLVGVAAIPCIPHFPPSNRISAVAVRLVCTSFWALFCVFQIKAKAQNCNSVGGVESLESL